MRPTVKALDVASTGTKAIVVETADYAKKSFEQNAATFEKLAGVKSLDQAIQIQSDYLQERLRGLCRAPTKTRELYTKLAQDSFAPFGFIALPQRQPLPRPSRPRAPSKDTAQPVQNARPGRAFSCVWCCSNPLM